MFAHPFDLEVEDCPDDCQVELIELQIDMENKMKYSENSLEDFYKLYVCRKKKCRSRLTNEHLISQLRVATTSVKADINKLCTNSKFQVPH